MKINQKKYEEKGTHYFFHSAGKWFLLVKHEISFDVQMRYGWSEEMLLKNRPFEVAMVKTIKDISGIGKIHYASFYNDTAHIVLLGIADVTIIAHEDPLEVIIEENPFEHYYNDYLNQYKLSEEHVYISLPEDDATRMAMLINDFYNANDAEYFFNSRMDIEYFQNLSSMRDSIIAGNVEGLLTVLLDYVKEYGDDEQNVENVRGVEKIVDGLMAFKKDDKF